MEFPPLKYAQATAKALLGRDYAAGEVSTGCTWQQKFSRMRTIGQVWTVGAALAGCTRGDMPEAATPTTPVGLRLGTCPAWGVACCRLSLPTGCPA